ncbi:hypothetical protein ACFL6S_29565 [Candidatus Poribacteria bacterium]
MFRIVLVGIILLSFCLFLACDNRKAEEDIPRIVLDDGYYRLRLPQALELEMKRLFSSYRLPEEQDFEGDVRSLFSAERLPYAIWGDFNGDGLTDVALILKEETEGKSKPIQSTKPVFNTCLNPIRSA